MVVIEDRSGNSVGCFAFKIQDEHIIIMEDFSMSDGIAPKEFIQALRLYMTKSEKSVGMKLRPSALVIALNMRNKFHAEFSLGLPSLKITSPIVGSFVILDGTKSVEIDQLRINPIWLEL